MIRSNNDVLEKKSEISCKYANSDTLNEVRNKKEMKPKEKGGSIFDSSDLPETDNSKKVPSKKKDKNKDNIENLLEYSENNDSKHSNTSSQKSNENPKELKNNNLEEISTAIHQKRRDKFKGYQESYYFGKHASFDCYLVDTKSLSSPKTLNQFFADNQLQIDESLIRKEGDEHKEIQKNYAQIGENIEESKTEEKEFISEVGQNHSEEDIRPEEVSGANTITDHHPQNIDTDKPAGAKDSNDGNFMSEDEKESYVNEVKISETQGASRDTIALIIINITLKYN